MKDEKSGHIEARTFLSAMWPTAGQHHQLATTDRRGAPGMRHTPVHDLTRSLAQAGEWAGRGLDCYFGCAEFRTPGSRKAENAASAAALWMDIDGGAAKAAAGLGYSTPEEAIGAVDAFCVGSGIPGATHINESGGGGIHVFWTLDRAIAAEQWRHSANQLKELARHKGLLADPTRTADIASVLRVPGTLNHKSVPPGLVRMVRSGNPIGADTMLRAVERAHGQVLKLAACLERGADAASVRPQRTAFPRAPVAIEQLKSAVSSIDPDCPYPQWVRVLMAIFNETRGSAAGMHLALQWSRAGSQFKAGEVERKWRTFKPDLKGHVGMGTLIYMARQEAFKRVH